MNINPYDATSRFHDRYALAYLTLWCIYALPLILMLFGIAVAVDLLFLS